MPQPRPGARPMRTTDGVGGGQGGAGGVGAGWWVSVVGMGGSSGVTCDLQVTVGGAGADANPRPPTRRRSAPSTSPCTGSATAGASCSWRRSSPGPRRFGELLDDLDGLAPNILSNRLKALEAEGLLAARPVLAAAPPGRLRAHRQRRRAGRRAPPPRAVGRAALRVATATRRRCTTPPAAPRSRRAGGVRPAPASSTTTRPPTSTGCDRATDAG